MKKIPYIETMKYYSVIKSIKPCHLKQHGWTYRYHAKWNKSGIKRHIPYDYIFVWYLNNKTNEHIKQNRKGLLDTKEQDLGVQSETDEWD